MNLKHINRRKGMIQKQKHHKPNPPKREEIKISNHKLLESFEANIRFYAFT